jgi:large subunit ribosomal protein L24
VSHIKQSDQVKIITGKHKGQVGSVLKVSGDYIYVQGINMLHHFVRRNPQADEEGGIRKKEGQIHISNIALWDEKEKKCFKVKMQMIDGKRVRCNKKSGQPIDTIKSSKLKKKVKEESES